MFEMQSTEVMYTLSLEDIKQLLAEKLNCEVDEIFVQDFQKVVSSHPMDRYPEVKAFAGLKITVKKGK